MPPISFTPPPGWPTPPSGFLPPADWRPDPSWPAPPAGWQFYQDGYGYPTPPPLEYWQPWPPVDWAARLAAPAATASSTDPAFGMGELPTASTKARLWRKLVAALLALALVGGLLAWGWPRLFPSDLPEPRPVTSLAGLYKPPLTVGAAHYQYAGKVTPAKSFTGDDACVAKANATLAPAAEGVMAGTDRGWGAVTWRFADRVAAQSAYTRLLTVLDGCTASDYTLGSPVHSSTSGQSWTQFSQTDRSGADHGRVVLSADANTLTWLEGGRTDMGKVAFAALRSRLSTLT